MGKGVEVRQGSIRIAFTFEGKRYRRTLTTAGIPLAPTAANQKYAHRLADEIASRIRHDTFEMAEYFPAFGDGSPLTVAMQLDAWLAVQRIEASTRAGYETAARFWKATIGDKPVRGLKRSDVMLALADTRLSGKTINNRTSVLRSALDLAVLDRTLAANPVVGLARAKQQKAPVEPFTAEESARIMAGAATRYPGALSNMVEFWFRTGLRTSELFGLRWSDIGSGVALIRGARVAGIEKASTKTNKTREVRLDTRALAALQRQRQHTHLSGAHVFADPFSGKPWANTQAFSRRIWVPLLSRLGVPYRRPYNIRHTRATEMLMAGLNPAFSARQLGHDVNVYLTVYAKWITGANDAAEMAKLELSPESPQKSSGER